MRNDTLPYCDTVSKAEIQSFKVVVNHLDPGFHRNDNFLQNRQTKKWPLTLKPGANMIFNDY